MRMAAMLVEDGDTEEIIAARIKELQVDVQWVIWVRPNEKFETEGQVELMRRFVQLADIHDVRGIEIDGSYRVFRRDFYRWSEAGGVIMKPENATEFEVIPYPFPNPIVHRV